MNPPYLGSLHLKILETAFKNINSIIINLSPILWMEFPNSEYKDGDFLDGHLNELSVINKETSRKLFNARNQTDLGIYTIVRNCNKSLNSYNPFMLRGIADYELCENKKKKMMEYKCCSIKDVITKRTEPLNGYCVIFSHMSGLCKNHDFVYTNGVAPNGRTYKENVKNQHKNETSHHIKFNSYKEADNFRKSLSTKFMKFIISVGQPGLLYTMDTIPFMKDYTVEWTDKKLYEFFHLNSSEISFIESFSPLER